MKILLNYADGKFLESQLKNSQSGLAAGFNVVYQMNRGEICHAFIESNKEIMSSKRGAGYWLWKSYFIDKIIKTLTPNDILFYADSGSVFVKRMEPIFQSVMDNPNGVMGFQMSGNHLEKQYTKRDLFIATDTGKYKDTPQRMASFMVFRGTDFAKQLVAEYLRLCSIPQLITDAPNTDGSIDPDFIDHRHDQSIWSLITKKNSIGVLPDPTQWGLQCKETTEDQMFIQHTRDSR